MANPRCYKCEVTSYYLIAGKSVEGCFSIGKCIPAKQKANFKMLQRSERPEQPVTA